MSKTETLEALIGDWYRDAHGGIFEVVAVDDKDGSVEIQSFDGTVDELDSDAWAARALATVEPPEDCSGALDIERADYGIDVDETRHDNWSNPLDYLDQAF